MLQGQLTAVTTISNRVCVWN